MTLVLSLFCALAPVQQGDSATSSWLEVMGLVPDGPAARAGIQIGDALASYDGKVIGSRAALEAAQAAVRADSVAVSLRRGNKELSFKLSKGKLGIYFAEWQNDLVPDSDATLLDDVPNLSWSRTNSFMGALEAIGQRLGDSVGYAFLCGASGAAFRTQFFDGWCPSSPDATVGFNAGDVALKACGLSASWQHPSDDGKNKPQMLAAVRKSIDAGMPVLGIDMVEMPEWGVIIGYEKNSDELFCHTYFDKHKRYEVARKFPFAVGILKREGRTPDENTSIRRGFDVVLENLTTIKYGQYYSGLAAFDEWTGRLRDDDFTKLDSAKLANAAQANEWIFERLIADRKTGIEYLDTVGKRMPALQPTTDSLAAIYQQEIGVLEPLAAHLPGPGSVKPGWQWSKVDRDNEIAMLLSARVFEEQTIPMWKKLAGRKQ